MLGIFFLRWKLDGCFKDCKELIKYDKVDVIIVMFVSSFCIEEYIKIRYQFMIVYEGYYGCLVKEKGKYNFILCYLFLIYIMSRVFIMVWFLGKREWQF